MLAYGSLDKITISDHLDTGLNVPDKSVLQRYKFELLQHLGLQA
jgi:hypothetical protein